MAGRDNNSGDLINPIPAGNGDLMRTSGLNLPVTRLSPGTAKDDMAQGMNLSAILGALRRRWFIATFLGLTFGIAGAVGAWMVIPAKYTTVAEMRVSSVNNKILFKTADERAEFETWKQTQIKLVKSPYVLSAAIRKPEISRTATLRAEQYPLDWLERTLLTSNSGTEFFKVSLSGDRPKELADIVNAITEAYLKEAENGQQSQKKTRLARLQKAQEETERSLQLKQNALKKLAESHNVGNTEQANQTKQYLLDLSIQMKRDLSEVEMELIKAKAEMSAAQVKPTETAAPTPPPAPVIPETVLDTLVDRESEVQVIAARITQLHSYIGQQQKSLSPNHKSLVASREELAEKEKKLAELKVELRPKVRERIAAEQEVVQIQSPAAIKNRKDDQFLINSLEARKTALISELENVQKQESHSGTATFDLDSLGKQIALSQTIADSIGAEIERLNIEMDSDIGISLFRKAEEPLFRDQRQKLAGTAAAGLGLFVLCAAAVVWLDLRSKRISVMDEVIDGLSLPVLGTIPMLPRFVTSRRSSRPHARSVYWQNVLTESIDATRTMLLRNAQSNGMNCVMITSAMEGEGKTTLACHLATSMARAGRSVILVDCDFRRPSIQKVFGMAATVGLSEVLRGQLELSAAIQPAGPPGLSVLAAGQFCSVVLQSLAQDGMGNVLTQLRSQFDFVIVDSSPILPVTDALLVAQHVDGVIFAIRRDVSRVLKCAAACQRMSMLGVPFLGAVVIGLDEGTYGSPYPYASGYVYGQTPAHADEAVTAS